MTFNGARQCNIKFFDKNTSSLTRFRSSCKEQYVKSSYYIHIAFLYSPHQQIFRNHQLTLCILIHFQFSVKKRLLTLLILSLDTSMLRSMFRMPALLLTVFQPSSPIPPWPPWGGPRAVNTISSSYYINFISTAEFYLNAIFLHFGVQVYWQ